MKTCLITSDTYQNHNTWGDGHPEKIDRVTAVIDNLKKLNNKNLIWKKPSKFDRSLLEITHNSDYINFVEESFPKKGLSFLDGDTIVSLQEVKKLHQMLWDQLLQLLMVFKIKNLKMLFVQSGHQDTMQKKIKLWVFVFITM